MENPEIIEQTEELTPKKSKFSFKKFIFTLVGLGMLTLVALVCLVNHLQKPPSDFPVDAPLIIEEGSTLREVAKTLKQENYVRSELLFFLKFVIQQEPDALKASTYVFAEPIGVNELVEELSTGNYAEGLIKFTHIEGETVETMADNAVEILVNFDREMFIALAKPNEGKLFPETYMIPEDYTAEEMAELLLATFEEKTAPLEEQINQHPLSLDEIIILASLLEREANSEESMKLVSGILQNRLEEGMLLQVDSSIEYILDKPLSELTPEDLKIDSPYNTYLNQGLPPTPIGNPGLDAIMAVLEPTPSEYMFYITGNDGEFYYAKTFNEHRINIERHLR